MKLEATLAPTNHQAGGLQNLKVLRYGLAGRSEAVFGRQPSADLEESLIVPLLELIENGPTGRVIQRPEQLLMHFPPPDHMQVSTCLSTATHPRSLDTRFAKKCCVNVPI